MRSIRARDVALAALVACAACKDPYPRPRFRGAGATSPHYGGTLRFAIDSDVHSLDPAIGYDEYSGIGIHLLFDTLVDYAPGSAELVPSLAERWDISPDGRVFTFHLRPNVRFHNGRLLVADDVRRTFERMLDPERVPCPNTSFYHLIDGFDDFQAHHAPHIRGIEVLDPLTVRFTLTQADQTFLNAMALPFAAPIPVEVADREGLDGWSQNPIGTGPFMLERWEQGSRMIFRRNPSYWRPNVTYLDRIVLEISLARHLQMMRFLRGDLDYIHTTSMVTADYVWIHGQRAWRPYLLDDADVSMYGLSMNTEIPPWNNRHLRRAVAFAIDRENICRTRNFRIRPLGGIYPPGLPGYDPNLPGRQHYDLARAREEMALAGFPNGIPDEWDIWVTEGEAGLFYAQSMQADVRPLGIRLRIRQASFATYLENIERRGAVPLALTGWSQDFPDPANFIETLFSTRNIQQEGSQNSAFYSNPQLDALLDRARIEPDRARRMSMYQQAEQMVVDDAPWAFTYYPTKNEAVQPYVRGYVISPVWSHDMRAVWLDLPREQIAARERSTHETWASLSFLFLPWSAQ